MTKKIFCILFTILLSTSAWSQSDTLDLYSLSLEDLMNISIVSVSKKSEKLFDAPLSATVITKEEIEKSGATSIMEALRLAPGLIVREQNNGNYDIHVRGLDNIPPNSNFTISTSITLLVMVDNRPIFNYLQGGTVWSALPVDLIDVERIEVVRGPSSTLYGPNAVSGVINIITTKTLLNHGINVSANVRRGSDNTNIVNGLLGYMFSNKLSGSISGSYNSRGRDEHYYVVSQDKWFNNVKDIPYDPFFGSNPEYLLPNPEVSLDKHTINAHLNYNDNDLQVNAAIGSQG